MADFYTVNVSYVIYFSDPDEYNFARSLIGGGTQLFKNPLDAAAMFDIPWPPSATIGTKGMYAGSEDFVIYPPPGSPIFNPGPTGLFMDPQIDSIEVPNQTPNPDPQIPADNKPTVYQWSAFIARGGDETVTDPPESGGLIDDIPKRRFLTGWEYPSQADGATNPIAMCRDASRLFDGVGGALRNDVNKICTRNHLQYVPTVQGAAFERFYVRIREFGNTNLDIFRYTSSVVTAAGVRLELTPTGGVEGIANNGFGVFTTVFSEDPQLVDNVWYKFDILLTNDDSVNLTLYINGVLVGAGGIAVVGSGSISTSIIGTSVTAADNDWEVDLDDWVGAGDIIFKNGLDFRYGSHIRAFPIIAVTHTDWAGEDDVVNQITNPTVVSAANVQFISTTASAVINGLTSFNDGGADDPSGVSFGAICAVIAVYSATSSAADAELGYSIAGNTAVYTTINEAGAFAHATAMYLNSGTTTVPDTTLAPLVLSYVKTPDTDQSKVNGLGVSAEYIGIWGIEDVPPDPLATLPTAEFRPINLHNCYYPNIPQSSTGPQPPAPVSAVGGTYIGNGETTTIDLPLPPHFIYIRPIKVNTAGAIWLATGFGGHPVGQEQIIPSFMVRVWADDSGGHFTVIGTNDRVNELGTVYQYIAFCDPAMRYNVCGAFMHDVSVLTYDNDLILDEFEPNAMFANFDLINSTSATQRMVYKGPGHAGVTANRLDGTVVTDAAELNEGVIVSKVDLHRQGIQTTYSAWRTTDCSTRSMLQITSYVGDAVASRTIPLPLETGKYPLWIYIQPHNGAGFYRDPSHLTTHSSNIVSGADSTTAIIGAAVDTIVVSTACNANGITYDVFCIMGDDQGFNNGEFNVPPEPCEWYIEPPVDPGDIAVFAEGGLEIGGNPPVIALRDLSGIYTLVDGKTNDTLYDRQTGQTNIDVKIPNPKFRTGYIGG